VTKAKTKTKEAALELGLIGNFYVFCVNIVVLPIVAILSKKLLQKYGRNKFSLITKEF